MKHVHFIGIGGSGLSAIARVLLEKGYMVSGSDRQSVDVMDELRALGARILTEHRPENVQGADVVVRSSAVPENNVEVQAARAAGIPVLRRTQFLPWLTSETEVIAVAGTHGKTTTTAMTAWILARTGLDPSYIIGGRSLNLGSNAHAGKGDWFVIEADEYDGMFLGLQPAIAVVTNVEHDHADCYPTYDHFFNAFVEFAHKVRPNGWLIVNAQDAGARRLGEQMHNSGAHVLTYGWEGWEDFYAGDITLGNQGDYSFRYRGRDSTRSLKVDLHVPGIHNVQNALAAMAVSEVLELDLFQAAQALAEYKGTGRRFELLGEARGVKIINDYAHHPTEIRATLEAARARYPNRTIWAIWQPHTYSRTRAFFNLFVKSFEQADHIVVLEIYAAREPAPEDGFASFQVVEAMRSLNAYRSKEVIYLPRQDQALKYLSRKVKTGDVVLVLSAGDAIELSDRLFTLLRSQEIARKSHGVETANAMDKDE